jgi:uncharacterized protein YaeQ
MVCNTHEADKYVIIFVEKRQLGRGSMYVDEIETYLREIESEGVEWIELAQDRARVFHKTREYVD